MLFVPTVLVGSLFGFAFTSNIFFAFFAGLISYFLINIIPHWSPENHSKKFVLAIRYADFVLGTGYFVFLVLVLFSQGSSVSFMINGLEVVFDSRHFFGALGGIIPFLFVYIGKIKEYKNKYFLDCFKLAKKFSYQDRSFWGIFVQIAITIVAITILFRLIDFPSWQRIVFQLSQ